MNKITDMLNEKEEDDIGSKLINAKFLIRMLAERVHSGQVKVSDVREVRRKINSILKEVSIAVKN